MVFADSTGPDITESIPGDISRRITSSAAYVAGGARYDFAIGGLPFLCAISDQRPYQRRTADFRKQQFDTSREAGEQSLDQWWTRDQASFHKGAGINYYEPGSDEGTQYRFKSSAGVDVWTVGEVSLLHSLSKTITITAGQSAWATTAVVSGLDYYFANGNGTVSRQGASGSAGTYTGATDNIGPVAVAGSTILVGGPTSIRSGLANGATLADLWTGAAASPRPYWVKGRIIAAVGAALYELTLAGGTWPAAALYTHPDTGWTWTSVVETPTAILASGYGSHKGAIFKFELETDTTGTVPKLGQPFQIAEFPPGEQVHAMYAYLSQYVAIGTNKGLRVALIDGNGNLQYGPLIIETANPVTAFSARDSFIYAGVQDYIDGKSGVVRVNLAEPLGDSLRFAYATDAQTHTTGKVNSVAFLGTTDRVVVAVDADGIYVQSATAFEPSGYLLTGAMRFATTEAKLFRRMKVRATPGTGTMSVSTVDEQATTAFIFRVGPSYNTNDDIDLTAPATAQEHISLLLTLEASSDTLGSPVLNGVQVKAIPQIKRQRLVQVPLLCMDREKDRNGVETGYNGGAADRFLALEALEDLQAVVQVQDFTTGESYSAQIEMVQLERTTPPKKGNDNAGGILTVTLRKL